MGMRFSNIIMYFIILSTVPTLYAAGRTGIPATGVLVRRWFL